MKAVIATVCVVLLILLVPTGVSLWRDTPSADSPVPSASAAPSTAETSKPPEPELLPQEPPVVLEGREVSIWQSGGVLYLRAADFAAAVGLTVEEASESTLLLTGRDTLEVRGKQLSVNASPVSEAVLTARGEVYLPLTATVDALNYPSYTDEESGITYITPSARPFEIPKNVNVPVLMYHAVSDDMWGEAELFVSPSDMETQLAYLVDHGYDPIWFEDLAHIGDYDKPVILTFDDGYDDNYTELFPLLKRYGVKATVFIIGNAPGTNHKMTEEQIREMSDSGLVSVQSHGYTHDDMNVMSEETLQFELGETKRVLTRITGKIPYVLCYPTGKFSDLTLEVAAQHYLFGIKMNGKQYNTSDDPFLVNRYYVSRYTGLDTFAEYVAPAGTSG